MDWSRHKDHWPHASHSRFVPAGTGRWHVQDIGQGDTLLLIHGAGGATQSWRLLMPLLAARYRVIAMDLPGQGFSVPTRAGRYGLDAMARDLRDLIQQQEWTPTAVITHSAGTAVALRLAELIRPVTWQVIGLNAALAPFKGVAGWAFPIAAKLMALNPLTAPMVAASSTPKSVAKLLDATGSKIDPDGQALYAHLVGASSHVNGTLRMMAAWDLSGLLTRLPQNTVRTTLIAGSNDQTVPAGTSRAAAARMPNGTFQMLEGLGHLAHEEAPDKVADAIKDILASAGTS